MFADNLDQSLKARFFIRSPNHYNFDTIFYADQIVLVIIDIFILMCTSVILIDLCSNLKIKFCLVKVIWEELDLPLLLQIVYPIMKGQIIEPVL